jgi:hypothetical protein
MNQRESRVRLHRTLGRKPDARKAQARVKSDQQERKHECIIIFFKVAPSDVMAEDPDYRNTLQFLDFIAVYQH